jgi:hypothetical protein
MVRYNSTPFCVNSIALETVKTAHFLCWWRDHVLSENLLSRMCEWLDCDFLSTVHAELTRVRRWIGGKVGT